MTLTIPPLLASRWFVVFLFISFRLIVLFAHQPNLRSTNPPTYTVVEPDGITATESGITAMGDYWYYFQLTRLSDLGYLPYRDYWYEFPPVFTTISLISYALVTKDGTYSNYNPYANGVALAILAFDTGSLLLIRRLGEKLHGKGTGILLGWLYAMLPISMIYGFWNFEPIVAFTILLSLNFFVSGRDVRGALGIVLGAATKVFPLVLLGAVWRFRERGEALRVTAIAAILTALVFGGVVALNREYGLASLAVQFNKASYQTVWALIDDNQKTGLLDPDRRDPASAYRLQGNPAVIPWWGRGILLGGIGLAIFMRTRRRDEYGFVAFVAVTVIIFFLWSQGWSPQWLVTLTPLILLCFPNGTGVLFCVTLAFVTLAEFPLLFSFGKDSVTGRFSPETYPLWVALVLLRTFLLAALSYAIYKKLRVSVPRKAVGEGAASA
ncbi:MAG TPA: hypothetical protein PLD47_04950 [Aggregatilineales bacterium]|nr:DUF2029 domain-containing protein [Anaerolineales bacterium]HRE47053.1 hypothetical protein [Aggregatilineales bacterium]